MIKTSYRARITYSWCCKIVLMFYNGLRLGEVAEHKTSIVVVQTLKLRTNVNKETKRQFCQTDVSGSL